MKRLITKPEHPYRKNCKKIEQRKKKQNPEKVDNEVKQVSEFEKKELFDPIILQH